MGSSLPAALRADLVTRSTQQAASWAHNSYGHNEDAESVARCGWQLGRHRGGSWRRSIAHLRLFGRRAADIYKKTGVLVLNAVVCFACLELASASVMKARVALVALIKPGEQEVLDPR